MADELFTSAQAASFGAVARDYQRGRPSYPEAALDWLLPPGARRVLDLGAGTGQLTRQLRDRGLDVLAVEPSDGMRGELIRTTPGVRVLAGTAETIPMPDGHVDAVLVAQAWHWVDPDRAVPEVARVLKPGGRLGLVWNIRDEREDWVAQLGALMHHSLTDSGVEQDMHSDDPRIGRPFSPAERFDVAWVHHLTRAALLDLVASRSYVSTLAPEVRATLLSRVRDLLDNHPALTGRDPIALPYITRCTRTDKRLSSIDSPRPDSGP